MRPKSLLAIVLGLVAMSLGVWRVTEEQYFAAGVAVIAGLFLVIRGLSNTVRPGL